MLKSRERSLNVQGIEQITYNHDSSRFIYNGAGLGRIFDFHKTQLLWSQDFTLVEKVQALRFDVKNNGENKFCLG